MKNIMIEVTAKLIRGHVFLSGEIVECSISFTHPPSPSHKISQSHNDIFESLAWASAQIHCQCFTDPKIGKQDDSVNLAMMNNTTLAVCTQEAGKVEVATKPKILFCDLRLSPGQTKTCKIFFVHFKQLSEIISCSQIHIFFPSS